MHVQHIVFSLFASAALAGPAGMKVVRDSCSSACMDAYNTCRDQADANRAECASEYSICLGYSPFDDNGSLVTPTACSSTITSTSSATSIPGGCNPAHYGSCPSSYFSDGTIVTEFYTRTSTVTEIVVATSAASSDSSVIKGAGWTIKDLVRYCSADGSGCDYNFTISTNDERADEKCNIVRMPGSHATTETFYNAPCTSRSPNAISWGLTTQFGVGPSFAILTVVNYEEKAYAYFGIADVNEGAVTTSSPAGSGNFGDFGPQPVYSFTL